MERTSGFYTALTTGRSSILPMLFPERVQSMWRQHSTATFSPILEFHAFYTRTNGREFVNSVIESLLAIWHSEIQLVSGRSRHPQSQGSKEKAHLTLQNKLVSEVSRNNSTNPPWTTWLTRLIYMSYIHMYTCIRRTKREIRILISTEMKWA